MNTHSKPPSGSLSRGARRALAFSGGLALVAGLGWLFGRSPKAEAPVASEQKVAPAPAPRGESASPIVPAAVEPIKAETPSGATNTIRFEDVDDEIAYLEERLDGETLVLENRRSSHEALKESLTRATNLTDDQRSGLAAREVEMGRKALAQADRVEELERRIASLEEGNQP